MSYTTKILISMLLGIGLGSLINVFLLELSLINLALNLFDAVGEIFISSLKLMVVPLVFFSLVSGVAQIENSKDLGSISLKAITFYLLTTALAISTALFFANFFNPGEGVGLETASTYSAPEAPSLREVLINIIPTNPIQAMADGEMLQIIVFSILVGFAVKGVGTFSDGVSNFFKAGNDLMLRLVEIIIMFAPLGIFCLLVSIFSKIGFFIIYDLAGYFFLLSFVLVFHALITYGSILSFFKLSPIIFFRKLREVLLFAFSTSSSSATMPLTLKTDKEKLGVDQSVASFCIPLGATINMDGTAIMQGIATVFIAQAYGVDLQITDYLMVILTATLASIGTAGVPGVGLIMLAMVLQQVGLPVEGIALIIGVDRLLDMLRTVVNISGDGMVTTVVAHSEKRLNKDLFNTIKN